MKQYYYLFALLCSFTYGQETIDVCEQTIKVKAFEEETLYYGFASGDKIIFNFEEKEGKELKELEILEYPKNSKFSDYKVKKISNKTIQVLETGVYAFRFKNTALGGRVCKIKLQRIPSSDATKIFNPNVTWETKQETTYNKYTKDVLVGYDTIRLQKQKRELVKTELKEEQILDKIQRVHSTTNDNGSRTSVFFNLPQDQTTPFKTSKVIAWAYWIGVEEAGNKAWKENVKVVGNLIKDVSKMYTSPLGALATGAVVDLIVPKIGEDVYYAVADETNKALFLSNLECRVYDHGKGVGGYRKFTEPQLCQGKYFILMSNDNIFQGIDTNVKVIAIIESNYFEDIAYTETTINPRYEKKEFSEPVVKTLKYPVTGK